MRFLILITLFLFALFLLFQFIGQYFIGLWRRKGFLKTTEGQIQAKLDYCYSKLLNNQSEMATIQENIRDLENKKADLSGISSENTAKANQLVEAFTAELQLRTSKADFYQTCIARLTALLNNHLLSKEILKKENQLRQLQENHYEELAQMESIKTHLEMDITYLDTIEQLSRRINSSTTLKEAERLNRELVEMTRGIEQYPK